MRDHKLSAYSAAFIGLMALPLLSLAQTANSSIQLSATPISGQAPLTVTFTATPSSLPLCGNTKTWNFGDGNSLSFVDSCVTDSSQMVPVASYANHTYQSAGVYAATLTTNGTRSNSVSITVGSSEPGTIPSLSQLQAIINSLLQQIQALQAQIAALIAGSYSSLPPQPTAAKFQVGDAVVTNRALNVHSSPSLVNNTLNLMQKGTTGTVLRGPMSAEGYNWYQVNYKNAGAANDIIGWSVDIGLNKTSGGYACTEEAKQCPDGSYVGRSGPSCTFAACPGTGSVSISSLNPSSGSVGAIVTITGTGFTSTGNKVRFGNLGVEDNPNYNLNSSDGRTLVFAVPSSNYLSCWNAQPRCLAPAQQIQPGTYDISVSNANGTSNAVKFAVTSTGMSAGQLYIEGGSSVGVGQTIQLKAFYQPAWSCPDPLGLGIACAAVMPAPIPVEAIWTSGNPSVASIFSIAIADTTGQPFNTATIKGISNGVTDINASYTLPLSGAVLTATTKITVGSGSLAPAITSFQPSYGLVGTKIILTGTGFIRDTFGGCEGVTYPYACDPYVVHTNTVHFGPASISNAVSDGKTLTLAVPDSYMPACPVNMGCIQVMSQIKPGTYTVSVQNANGTSNQVSFVVTQ